MVKKATRTTRRDAGRKPKAKALKPKALKSNALKSKALKSKALKSKALKSKALGSRKRAGLPNPDSVVSETTLRSPSGRTYRVLRTTERDPYDRPDKPGPKRH